MGKSLLVTEAMSIVHRVGLLVVSLAGLAAAAQSCHAHGPGTRCVDHGAVLLQTQSKLMTLAERVQNASASPAKKRGTAELCRFTGPPTLPYFWDPSCKHGGLGCRADGIHDECRYCGDAPFTNVECPTVGLVKPKFGVCTFKHMPAADFYWDSECKMGMLGCYADDRHEECRFCGGDGDYENITCPKCTFAAPMRTPHYWDNDCRRGGLGCNADGLHPECRFCGSAPFESVPCPEWIMPSNNSCSFPNEPRVSYYWDTRCKLGVKGCNADGLHVQCRFCGSDVYSDIACP